MKKIKIVLTDTAPLYPPLWGGPKRIWNLFSNLSKDIFDIDYVGLDFPVRKGYIVKKVGSNFREFIVFLPSSFHFWNFWQKMFFKRLSLPLFAYLKANSVREFKNVFNNVEADIFIVSHPWAGGCIRKDDKKLFIYDAHNCEYHLMLQILGNSIIGKIVSFWVKKIEKKVCCKSDIILTCSDFDSKIFREIYGVTEDKLKVIPNGTIINGFASHKEKKVAKDRLGLDKTKPVIFFVGSMYEPNIEAANFIVKKLAKNLNNYTFVLAGTVCRSINKENLPKNIHLFPECNNDELDMLLKASYIGINPVMQGSGTSIKVLEYAAYGLPIITTTVGCRGLKFEHMKHIYITTLENFPNAIKEINRNKALFNKLRNNAYNFLNSKYNWVNISKKLETTLKNLHLNLDK